MTFNVSDCVISVWIMLNRGDTDKCTLTITYTSLFPYIGILYDLHKIEIQILIGRKKGETMFGYD